LNPVLTQLARSKRIVFVEGKEFQLFARFATKLGVRSVATRAEFAVVPTEGFNPGKARTFVEGVQATLASKISVALIFDRDYRPDSEVAEEMRDLKSFCAYAHIHSKKELENFLLIPAALGAAIDQRCKEQSCRTAKTVAFADDIGSLLVEITDTMKHNVQAQYLKRQLPYVKSLDRSIDDSTVTSQLLAAFDDQWMDLATRLDMVPGKDVLSQLNARLQKTCGVNITPALIVDAMTKSQVPNEMKEIINALDRFSSASA
jgi:hypothetical protein